MVEIRELVVTENRRRVEVPRRSPGPGNWGKPERHDSAPWAGSQGLDRFWFCCRLAV